MIIKPTPQIQPISINYDCSGPEIVRFPELDPRTGAVKSEPEPRAQTYK